MEKIKLFLDVNRHIEWDIFDHDHLLETFKRPVSLAILARRAAFFAC